MPNPPYNYDERRAIRGLSRTGTVSLYDFDRSMVETLGAKAHEDGYQLMLPNVPGPPANCGIPVVFANPEDVLNTAKLPRIVIRRTDMIPAMDRYQPGTTQYRTASYTAQAREVTFPDGSIRRGWSEVEELPQAEPYDFTYDVLLEGRYRGTDPTDTSAKGRTNELLRYVMRVFPAFGCALVRDSLGAIRKYPSYQTGITTSDTQGDVSERKIGFVLNVRIEGEIDVYEPYVTKTISSLPTIRLRRTL